MNNKGESKHVLTPQRSWSSFHLSESMLESKELRAAESTEAKHPALLLPLLQDSLSPSICSPWAALRFIPDTSDCLCSAPPCAALQQRGSYSEDLMLESSQTRERLSVSLSVCLPAGSFWRSSSWGFWFDETSRWRWFGVLQMFSRSFPRQEINSLDGRSVIWICWLGESLVIILQMVVEF